MRAVFDLGAQASFVSADLVDRVSKQNCGMRSKQSKDLDLGQKAVLLEFFSWG